MNPTHARIGKEPETFPLTFRRLPLNPNHSNYSATEWMIRYTSIDRRIYRYDHHPFNCFIKMGSNSNYWKNSSDRVPVYFVTMQEIVENRGKEAINENKTNRHESLKLFTPHKISTSYRTDKQRLLKALGVKTPSDQVGLYLRIGSENKSINVTDEEISVILVRAME